MGITILSRATIAKELKLNLLSYANLDPPMERAFSFVRQRQKFTLHAMEQLLAYAQNYCHEHADT